MKEKGMGGEKSVRDRVCVRETEMRRGRGRSVCQREQV